MVVGGKQGKIGVGENTQTGAFRLGDEVCT